MDDKPFWCVSDYNRKPDILGETHFPKKLKFYDTTLRDGEQTVGLAFSKQEKLQIAQLLDGIGVDRIEAGMPVVSREDKDAVELILKAGLEAEIWGFCRAVKSDIDACVDVGVKSIICEIATSSYKMRAYNFTPEGVLKKVLECIQYAKQKGLYVAFFAVDATRSDINYLQKIYTKAVEEGGADEAVIVDTLGVASPETMFFLTRSLKEWVDVPVMTHCHNDFGMGVACTMASVKAGAEYAQVTINGLGEKTGNVDLAEIAVSAALYGIPIDLKMKSLYPAAKAVERISNIPISPLKPVVGENVFKRESGVTIAQLMTYPPAVEGFSPEVLGREREVVLGKKSGKKSLEYKFEKLGLSPSQESIGEILEQVKELGIRKKGLISDEELMRIVQEVQK